MARKACLHCGFEVEEHDLRAMIEHMDSKHGAVVTRRLLDLGIDPSDWAGRTLFVERDDQGVPALSAAPGQHVCDFCTTPGPTWQFPCGYVAIEGVALINASADEWLACDACRDLIEADRGAELVARAVRMQMARTPAAGWQKRTATEATEITRRNVDGFLRARTGRAVRIDPATAVPLESPPVKSSP